VKGISGFYYVDTENGLYECKARGILRKDKITPLVGDRVKMNVLDEVEKKGIVEEIEGRDSELIRPPIANVDKALIVFAIKNPNITIPPFGLNTCPVKKSALSDAKNSAQLDLLYGE